MKDCFCFWKDSFSIW